MLRERWGKAGRSAHTRAGTKEPPPRPPPKGDLEAECQMVRESCPGPGKDRELEVLLPACPLWGQDRVDLAPEDHAPGCAYRERPGTGASADSSGSAPSAAARLYTDGKTSRSAPGSPRPISREATAALQVSFTPFTCPSVPRAVPSPSATCPPRGGRGGLEKGSGHWPQPGLTEPVLEEAAAQPLPGDPPGQPMLREGSPASPDFGRWLWGMSKG